MGIFIFFGALALGLPTVKAIKKALFKRSLRKGIERARSFPPVII